MTEYIDIWVDEFIKLFPVAKNSKYYAGNGFIDKDTNLVWHGFLMAKRSQPVVELPKKYWVTEYHSDESDYAYACNEVHNSLTAAGIQYRIKGE